MRKARNCTVARSGIMVSGAPFPAAKVPIRKDRDGFPAWVNFSLSSGRRRRNMQPSIAEEQSMNDDTMMLDQADEDILASEVSDETLEAAADTNRGPMTGMAFSIPQCCANE